MGRATPPLAQGSSPHFIYASNAPDAPDFMLRAGVPFRLIKDHLGSVRVVVNALTGIAAQLIDYEEFGNVTRDTTLGEAVAPSADSELPTPLAYASPAESVRRSVSARSDTQEVTVLPSSPLPVRARRIRVGWATLGVVLAGAVGAAAVTLAKQSSRKDATSTPRSAAPAVSATQAPVVANSVAPAAPPPTASASSSASADAPSKPRSTSRPKTQTRRTDMPIRGTSPSQPPGARDPYEQR